MIESIQCLYWSLNDFQRGYVLAVAVVLGLFIVVEVLVLLLRPGRKCKGVSIPLDDGELFVAAQAVTDMVDDVAADGHPELTLRRVRLLQGADGHGLRLSVTFKNGESSLPEALGRLKSDIFAALEGRLGIHTLKSIDIAVPRVESQNRESGKGNDAWPWR